MALNAFKCNCLTPLHFKNQLDKHWTNQEVFFLNFNADLTGIASLPICIWMHDRQDAPIGTHWIGLDWIGLDWIDFIIWLFLCELSIV